MDLASALQSYREAMSATQNSIVEAFVDQLLTYPRRLRDAKQDEVVEGDIDDRLKIFSIFYWGQGFWIDPGESLSASEQADLPEGVEPVTSLEGVASVLPAILATQLARTNGTSTPKPDEEREEYLRDLDRLVMAKAQPDHAPVSLPAEYEALLKLTDGLHSLDLLKLDICEVGGARVPTNFDNLEESVPDPDKLEDYEDWPVSAGFYLGMDHESTCKYVYCRNTSDDADEDEREWAWRISFESFCSDAKEPYLGDLAGLLRYYPSILDPEKLPKRAGIRVRDICSLATEAWDYNGSYN
ncbi:hypothetical protein F5Y14DRAFT_413191 [Nemania sp. NC0429]|nr:hypothetical protein F5Y14DRAFT_413191 [Nemania sp. NC0429]